jgi:hypothetical protein
MLALYYSVDKALQKAEPNMAKYADLCSNRVKNFLQGKVVIEEDFNTAISLFAISITPELPPTEDLPSLNKIRDQEKVSDVIGMAILGDEVSPEELSMFSDVMDIILGIPEANDIMDFMGANPEIVLKILRGKKRKTDEIADILTKAATSSAKSLLITSDFAQLAGLIACSMMAFVGNFFAVTSFTAIAAAAIIPVSIAALKYGAEFGEKIGSKLAEFEKDFKMASDLLSNIIPTMEYEGLQTMNIQKSKAVVPEMEVSKINLEDITKHLSAHVDFTSTVPSIVRGNKAIKEAPAASKEREI